jgi:hypothetical protein
VITLSLVVLAVALMVIGAALPWLVVFNGLTAIRGFSLDGGMLGGAVLAVVALLYVQARHGGARYLRPLAIVIAFAVAADSVYSAWRIDQYIAAPGPTGVLTAPAPGSGPYVLAFAGVLLVVAAAIAPAAPGRLTGRSIARLALALLLLIAATIHLILTPEHLGISTILGLGFLAAGLAQLVLAAAALGGRGVVAAMGMNAVVVVNIALIAIYVYAVLVGLPIEAGHADDAVGLALGAGEPVDVKGGVDFAAEVAAVVIAAVLSLGRSGLTEDASAVA